MVAELVEHAQTRQEPSSRPGQARAEAGAAEATGLRTYVVDTSVLLSDPRALLHFAEHEVVLPLVVVSELEAKRADPDLGYYARTALRLLDDLRGRHGALDQPVPITPEGGTLRIELNHVSVDVLPLGIRGTDNDSRILAVAKALADEGATVTVVSKDLPMRVKAAAMGLAADEYRHEIVRDSGWRGTVFLSVAQERLDALYDDGEVDLAGVPLGTLTGTGVETGPEEAPAEADRLPVNTGLVLTAPRGSALARVGEGGRARLVRGDRDVFGLHGRSAEQRLAIELLTDPGVGIVSLGGRAGTGKSALALCAGLDAVMERREHRRVVVFRPLYAVGGQDLGYLPGSEGDKMGPWAQAVFDTLGALVSPSVVDEVVDRGMLEILPLTHIRGRSLHDAWVIVDEAQSLERNVLLTVLSRMGRNSKVVLTHDVAQRDNLRVGRHDGIAAVVERLKGHPLFGHVTLTRSERSPIAALVTDLLEEGRA
ncbi:PhoH family protein [Micrococcus luteus]|uniref:PhoH family protein n=1 Tax=Micrococcus luteus TaxID=1270 RepID=UPI0012DCE5F1|nr:PhoH family protein [Micrococcus luteus]QGS21841.1 AAA family ATPase [Micrococcus luteus]QHG59274.1 PhoH family protein [Micrococcus luteus]